MKTLAIGTTKSGGYWAFLFETREEALVFLDVSANTPTPEHEMWDVRWDLVMINTTTVAEAIKDWKGEP